MIFIVQHEYSVELHYETIFSFDNVVILFTDVDLFASFPDSKTSVDSSEP